MVYLKNKKHTRLDTTHSPSICKYTTFYDSSLVGKVLNRITILLFIIVMTLGISYGMHVHTISIFAKSDVGATYDDLAAIGIAKFFPYVLAPLFIGVILNRTNKGYILAVGIAMHAIPLLLVSMAETILEIIFYQFIIGAAHAFLLPPVNSIFSAEPKTRVRRIAQAVLFHLLGLSIGPLIGMFILDVTGENYRLLFQIASMVMSSSMIVTMLLRAKLPSAKQIPVDIKSFGRILHFPVVIALVLFTTSIWGIIFVIYPAFLIDQGISVVSVSFLYCIYGVVRVGTMLAVNYLHKWISPILTLCIGLTTVGLAISSFGVSFAHFAVAMTLMAFCTMAYPICLEIVLARTKRSIANKMIGAYASLVGLGLFLGPAIAGYTAHWYGETAPYWIFTAVGIAMTVAAITLHRVLAIMESKFKQAVRANQFLKHDFNIILLNVGLMDKALIKARTYMDVPAEIRLYYGDMDRVFVQIDDLLSKSNNVADPTLVDDISAIITKIKNIDVTTGVNKGYPEYDKIKEDINKCVQRLDEAVAVDVMLNIRHWVNSHVHYTNRST